MKAGVLAALLAFGLPPRHIDAQTMTAPVRVWGAFGLGGASAPEDSGMAFLGQLAGTKQPHYFALRGVIAVDPYDSAQRGFGDVGVVYGRTAAGSIGHVAVGAGLGLAAAENRGPELGIPLVAEGAISLEVIGLGAQVFGNLNRRATFFGIVLFLQLGWLP